MQARHPWTQREEAWLNMLSPKNSTPQSKGSGHVKSFFKLWAMAPLLLFLLVTSFHHLVSGRPRCDPPDDDDIMDWLADQDDFYIELFRRAMEGTDAGIKAIQTSADRRLYATLKPSREENLQRIENAIGCMDPTNTKGLRKGMKGFFKFYGE